MDLHENCKTVYTAQSKHYAFAQMLVCQFAIESGAVPLNPFNLWGYFLYELVDRDLIRRANNNVIRIVDEVWVFGPIADGVLAEIEYACELKKPLHFFSIGSTREAIHSISVDELVFEPAVVGKVNIEAVREKIRYYQSVL